MNLVTFDDEILYRAAEVATMGVETPIALNDQEMLERASAAYGLETFRLTDDDYQIGIWRNVEPLRRALLDTTGKGLDLALHVLGDLACRICDASTLHPLLALGVNPLAMHVIETCLVVGTGIRSMAVRYGPDGKPAGRMHLCLGPRGRQALAPPWDHAEIELTKDMWWDGRSLSIPNGMLPETALSIAAGQPLSRLVQTPFELPHSIITDVVAGETCSFIATDRRVDPITWGEAHQQMRGEKP